MAKNDILAKIKAIKSSENIGDFFKKRYEAITDAAKGQKTLAKEVSRIYGIASEIEEGTGLDWNAIYSGLAYIAKTRPNLMGRVAEAFNEALKSNKNNSSSIGYAYKALESVIEKQPNLSEQVIDIVKVGMQSDKNNVYSFTGAYDILASVVEKRPDLSEKVMDIFEFGISSEKQKSAGYYGNPTNNLSSIIKSRPELTDRVLNILETKLNAGVTYVSSFYGLLENALSARPEMSDRIFQIFKKVVQSDRDGKRSSSYYCDTPMLKNVAQKYPNLRPQVIDAYKAILQLGGIDEDSLDSIYVQLETFVEQQPDLTKQVLEALEVGMKSNRDHASLHIAFNSLDNITNNRRDSWEQVVGICETVACLDYVDSRANEFCQKEVYSLLESFIGAQQSLVNKKQSDLEFIERIFQAFEKMGQATHQESDGRSVALITGEFPRTLKGIVQLDPSLASRALDVLKKVPPSFVCSEYSNFRFFETIAEHPELLDQVVDIIKAGCQQNAIDRIRGFKDSEIFYTLNNIIRKRPDLTEQVLDVYEILTQSDSGAFIFMKECRNLLSAVGAQSKSARRIWDIFEKQLSLRTSHLISLTSPHILFGTIGDIVKNNPDLAERAFETLNNEFLLKSSSDSLSHSALYKCLENVVAAKPDLAERTFDLFVNKELQSSSREKGHIYEMLGCIVEVRPDLINRVFQVIENELQSGKNIPADYDNIFKTLAKIAQKQPQFADRVFKNFDKVLDSIDEPSMDYVSRCLSEVVQEQPKLAEQVFDTFQKGFQVYKKNRPKNDRPVSGFAYVGVNHFLLRGYDVLRGVVNAQPDLTEQSFGTIKEMLKSDDNSSTCLTCAYNTLIDYVKAKPELAEQIFETTAEGKESPEQIYVYKACMSKRDVLKRLPPMEEIISKYPTIRQDLLVAYNGRQLEDDVFRHAAGLIDRRLLLDTDILKNQPSAMKTLEKAFEQENADVKENSVRDFLIPTGLKFAAFPKKGYVADYIKRILTHNKRNPENKLTLHDAMYWLPDPMDKEASEHFMNFISKEGNLFYANDTTEGKEVHRPLEELTMIAQNWKSIENQMRDLNKDITKLSYAKILDICKSNKYKNQRNMSFAVEAASHGVPEKKYHQCEDIYLAGLKVPEPFDSKKTFKEGKYVGRFLPRDDARTLFFGAYTDCCQHFDGAGGACAISTVKDPFSQLFVIEDTERKNKIVAGSWVWENTEGNYREVCFDNIEIKEPSRENLSEDMKDRREKIISIYNQVGKYLTEEANCHRVTAGTGYDDAKVRDYYEETECIALPTLYKDGYSDAKEKQVLLAENSNATPLDKNKESQRYIRNVCYLDEKAMQNVSKKSFPEGDQELQNPENMDGFVVEDYDKGVVGYCLYDRGKKSIYDMAVLPEYRTDGNPSSSTKLFKEVMEVIRKDGGKWTAEMRDETTLRFLKLMAKKGLVKYTELGVDHEMSDGSKVVKVEFEPVKGTRDAIRSLQDQDKEPGGALDPKIAALSGGPTH